MFVNEVNLIFSYEGVERRVPIIYRDLVCIHEKFIII
jgi:hypothetical protein